MGTALLYQLQKFWPVLQYPVKFLGYMGEKAVRAVFDPGGGIGKLTAAFVVQNIERTVAEHAVEALGIGAGVTGKVFAVLVAEETVAMVHSMLLF